MELDSICRWAKGQEAKNPGHAPRCGGGWDRDPRAGPEARVARTPQPQNARLVPGHLGVGLTARLVWKDVVRGLDGLPANNAWSCRRILPGWGHRLRVHGLAPHGRAAGRRTSDLFRTQEP